MLSVDRLHGPEASVASQQPSISPCKMMEATLWSCVWLCVTQSVTGSYPVPHSQVTCLHTDDGAGYSLLVHPPCHKHYVTPPGPPPHLLMSTPVIHFCLRAPPVHHLHCMISLLARYNYKLQQTFRHTHTDLLCIHTHTHTHRPLCIVGVVGK